MSSVDFFGDVVSTGRMLGLGLDASLSEWEQVLGHDFIEDIRRSQMRRDYGLVELTFELDGRRWVTAGIAVQVHRQSADGAVVPEAVTRTYGLFARRFSLAELVSALASRGLTLEATDHAPGGGHLNFRAPASEATVTVVDADDGSRGLRMHDIWSIHLTRRTG